MFDMSLLFGAEDRVTPVVRRMKREVDALKLSADRVNRSLAGAGAIAGRFGGTAGGLISRATGGFAGGLGMGVTGVAGLVAGMAYGGIDAASERSVIKAQTRAEWRNSVGDATQRARETVEGTARGGMSYVQSMRRAFSRGASMDTIATYAGIATDHGLTTQQGLDIFDATASNIGVNPVDVAKAMRTGFFGSAAEAAQQIKALGSVDAAVALAGRMTKDQARYTLGQQEGDPYHLNITDGKWDGPTGMDNIGAAVAGGNAVEETKIGALVGGGTATAVSKDAWGELNPLAKALAEMSAAQHKQNVALKEAADAQWEIPRRIQEVLRAIGMGDGSRQQRFTDHVQAQGNP